MKGLLNFTPPSKSVSAVIRDWKCLNLTFVNGINMEIVYSTLNVFKDMKIEFVIKKIVKSEIVCTDLLKLVDTILSKNSVSLVNIGMPV